jgi:NAD(P)-dependent dehydrogenase (short-subunit alcohol dehydrogenase family)
MEPLLTKYIHSYPADRAKLLLDINVNGVFYTAREGARRMIPNKKGSIILIGSMSANVCTEVISMRQTVDRCSVTDC